MIDQAVEDMEKRWRKSVLPFAILAVLGKGPVHGYGLAVALREVLGTAIPEGTLYPLLNGFERDGLTVSEWAIQESGPARKTYALTDSGQAVLEKVGQGWTAFTRNIGGLVT